MDHVFYHPHVFDAFPYPYHVLDLFCLHGLYHDVCPYRLVFFYRRLLIFFFLLRVWLLFHSLIFLVCPKNNNICNHEQ